MFHCDAGALARLEWPRLAECLAACTRTAIAGERCRGELFEATRAGAADRLAETSEVRRLLDAGEPPPLGGIADLRPLLRDLATGVLARAPALAALLETLRAADGVRRFFGSRAERAPRMADAAATLPDMRTAVERLARLVTPEGEIREDASSELRRARRSVRDHQSRIEQRMAAHLRHPEVRRHLQDGYSSARSGRPVLPVRSDSRSRVAGIVHDVSQSGTTLFIEPADVVELGNQLRIAEREVEREVERLLREISDWLAEQRADLEALQETLAWLDLGTARARLSQKLEAAAPELGEPLALLGLRHPLLLLEAGLAPSEIVANDIAFEAGSHALVISGPNAGGKTVVAKALGLAALALRAGLHVPCEAHSRLPIFDAVHADIGDDQDLRAGLSTFSARMANLARILERADANALVILDEVGEGTEPAEGAALAQAVLEALVERGTTVIATTHFNRLKELAGQDPRFANASAEFDPDTLRPTYRIHLGAPGASGASHVARRMGVPGAVVARASALLDGRERDLESLALELGQLRRELEQERAQAAQSREQLAAARERYEARVDQLTRAREQALAEMRGELDAAYDAARGEIAEIMRSLQRSGRGEGAAASRASVQLEAALERVEKVEEQHRPVERARGTAVDWTRAAPGDRLEIEGFSRAAVLLEGPDRRGRVTVHIGATRTSVPAERVLRWLPGKFSAPPSPSAFIAVERADADEGSLECDLRGMRVDEALDRADAHLNRLLGTGAPHAAFIHGHGSGALRRAIRAWLRDIPQVVELRAAAPEAGGEGVTIARFGS